MRKVYEEYLYVPEEGKIKESVFIMWIADAIVCMVCCLSAMGFSAYAFFTRSITSGSNTIVAATYNVEIQVSKDEKGSLTKVTPTENQLIYTYDLSKGAYIVTLKASGNAKMGYCKIVVGDMDAETSEKYFTIQISTDETDENHQLEFQVECYEERTQVHIIPNWGSCSEKEERRIGYNEENTLITIGTPTKNSSKTQKVPVDISDDEKTKDTAETKQESPTDTTESQASPIEPEENDIVSEETRQKEEETEVSQEPVESTETSTDEVTDEIGENDEEADVPDENGEDTSVSDETVSE